ncbi:MAG: anticodon nuclease [Thomasclavelia sp.]|uniref:anticodon nuclease n=1 Tax=Thomasclavelia sp. TaxID=3025757 RepID=UPI0039A26948
MGKTLKETAQELKDNNKKVQLIYAFNGNGKTRLSREFKTLVSPKIEIDQDETEEAGLENKQILYYNAFTEDLFYWDNDLKEDAKPKLKIHSNVFTKWIFEDQGQDQNVVKFFQHYTNDKLNPSFNSQYTIKNSDEREITVNAFTEIIFSYKRGDNSITDNIKISKGEESCFIWSVFYALLEQVVSVLNVVEESDRETNQFDNLNYIFIDDPVTSLDDNHLIQMAVDLAEVIRKSESELKFIITTHNPVFYNVLYNEINTKKCYMLNHLEDGLFDLSEQPGGSNMNFSYHLHLKAILEEAVANDNIEKFHFTLLRNLYEKTASFLGFPRWSELLPENKETYYKRIIQFTSHSTLANEIVAEPTPQEKQTVKLLLEHLINNYSFWKEE